MPEKHRDLTKTATLDAGACRAREIVASLRADEPADVFDAFWELDALPADDVRDALVPWVGPMPDLDRLDPARRISLGVPLRPLRLRTLSVAKDADILDLGPVAEQQLQLAGKSWDGTDLPAEERLDGELEDSLAGTLERRVLADAEAPGETPVFDVLLFAEGAGVVFAAGTGTIVALIAYGKVELRDRRTRVAVEEAIAAPVSAKPALSGDVAPPTARSEDSMTTHATVSSAAKAPTVVEETVVASTTEKAVAKKAAAKTTPVKKGSVATAAPAKKGAAKKTPAKKTPAKKAGAKKSAAKMPAKKTAAKKTPAKMPAKKTAAKKTPAKKTVAKKAAAKTPAKKSAAKKTPAKKAGAKKAPAKKTAAKKATVAKRAARRPKK